MAAWSRASVQALTEACVYDDNGQLISASYMDYSMPKADDVPSFQVAMTVTPCTHNTLGVKGCGRPARRAAGGDERDHRCHRRAISTCRRRRRRWRACRAGRCPRRRNREAQAMYTFEYHRPSTVAEAVSLLQERDRGPVPGGRPHA